MRSTKELPVSVDAILELNGVKSAHEIRAKSILMLPTAAGQPTTFRLDRTYRKRSDIIAEYWNFHPRFRFLKTAPLNAVIADLGAGPGGLVHWRRWNRPDRNDLRMYAVDMNKGEFFDHYDGHDVVDLNSAETRFDESSFDCIILSHVIEHIENQAHLFREVSRISKTPSTAYLEWPHPNSVDFINNNVLSQIGIAAGTINFFDDQTHLKALPAETVTAQLNDHSFQIEERGVVRNDYMAEEMFAYGFHENDSEIMTYALWLAFGFSQYLVARR